MKENEVYEIDLLQVFEIVKKNIILFLIICILSVSTGFLVTKYVMKEEFTSSVDLIVTQSKEKDSTNNDITYSDLQLFQKLANTYSQILTSDIITDRVANELNLVNDYNIDSYALKNMISVVNVNSTEIIRISVKTNYPKLSADVANKLIDVFKDEIYKIIEIDNISVINQAKVPTKKSGPNTIKNMSIAGAIGLVICAIITIIQTLKDTKVKTEEEIKAIFPYPIIGIIPLFKTKESEKKTL